MTAVRYQIALEAKARMETLGAAEVELMPSADPVEFDAIHLFDDGQGIGDAQAMTTQYDMRLRIECYFEQAGQGAAYLALNDRYAQVVAAMMAEPPMGGLAETIEEGSLRIGVASLASKPRLYFAVDFDISFATRRMDPAQAA